MSTVEATEIQQLKDEIVRLKADIYTLQRNQSSRKGDSGARGEKGDRGSDGRSAVIKFVHTDGKVQVITFDDNRVQAEIVPVVGAAGRDGRDGVSPSVNEILARIPIPRNGSDGKDAPSLDEIVAAVVKSIGSRLQ